MLSQTGGHGDFTPREDAPRLCACQIHTSGFSHVADGVPAVRKAAREELRRGATQVKIMASGGVASPSDPIWNLQYSAEEMRAIVEEAEGWRTYAMAHAYTPEAIRRAVDAGVRTIEHGNLIDRATAEHMRAKGAYLVPTLVTYFAIDELGREARLPGRQPGQGEGRARPGPRLARDRARGGPADGLRHRPARRDARPAEPRVRDPRARARRRPR